MLRWFRKTYPSYDAAAARAGGGAGLQRRLGERRAQEGQRHLDDVSRLTEAVHRQVRAEHRGVERAKLPRSNPSRDEDASGHASASARFEQVVGCSGMSAAPGPADGHQPTASTAAVSSLACAAPRSTFCARCPAASETLHVGSAEICGCGARLRSGGAGSGRSDRCEPCRSCAHEVRCAPSAALRRRPVGRPDGCLSARRPLSLQQNRPCQSLAHPGQVLVRGLGAEAFLGIALRGVCCRGCGLESSPPASGRSADATLLACSPRTPALGKQDRNSCGACRRPAAFRKGVVNAPAWAGFTT